MKLIAWLAREAIWLPCFLFSICLEEDTDIVITGGFQAWIGGECVYICLKAIWPSIEEQIPNHMAQSM